MQTFYIGENKINLNSPPFIIAEMSANHNQSLERALQIVDAAAQAGVQAVKLQTSTPDGLTLDIDSEDFVINDPKSLWNGQRLYELYQKAHTPWDWHEPIFKKCEELGLIAFSTPFEEKAVDFLESLNVPCYKIASFESTDLPLIKKVASTGKPAIISTGMATVAEIDEAIRTFKYAGGTDVLLLKCTSTYPASPDDINLFTIPHMRELFGTEVGLSDHTLGVGVALASIALGATVIEKHFTLCRSDGGVDSVFSMEPEEMRILVEESSRVRKALGHIQYGPTENEKESLRFRRSLYLAEDMNNGDLFTSKNLRVIRPGYGLYPKYYEILLNKRINKSAKKGDPVTWDLIG